MFPVLVRHLIDKLGYVPVVPQVVLMLSSIKWAIRICGFIILYACTFAFFVGIQKMGMEC